VIVPLQNIVISTVRFNSIETLQFLSSCRSTFAVRSRDTSGCRRHMHVSSGTDTWKPRGNRSN